MSEAQVYSDELAAQLSEIGPGWSLTVIGGEVLQAERKGTVLHRQESLTPENLLRQVEKREAEIAGDIPRGITVHYSQRDSESIA